MSTLDNPMQIPDIPSVPFKQTALRYGLIGGAISIVFGLIFYLTGMTDPTDPENTGNTIANIVNYAVLIGTIIMALKHHRDNELNGYLTLGRSIGLGTLVGLVLGVMGAIWTVLFFTVIDPDMLEGIKEMAMEQAIQNGAPEDQVEGMIGFFTSIPFFVVIIMLFSVIGGLVVGLIAGAIMKKDPPALA